MADKDGFNDYCSGLRTMISKFEKCWREKEGVFEVKITDESGQLNWAIKGGETLRSKRLRSEEE